jgi:hypothetical protein
MCGLEKQSTNLPEPAGPTDDTITYSVTERGQRALAARLHLDAERSARRRAWARALRQQGRRCGTVYSRFKHDRFVPELRLCGAWLEAVGFDLGQVFEVGVEERKLVIRAV